MASRGMGRTFQRGAVWWIAYSWRGKEHRESSESTKSADAARLLKKRLGEIGRGRLIGPTEERLTFEDLAADFVQEHRLAGKRQGKQAEARVGHLRRYFGDDRALDITTPRIRAYMNARLGEGAAPATVNRDLAALCRMFNLAKEATRLSVVPHIPKLPEAQPRQGFFEHAEYLAIRRGLPVEYQDVLDFGYMTGWRRAEITGLEWRDVEIEGKEIRLRPELSKNGEARVYAMNDGDAVHELMKRRLSARTLVTPRVFHKDGRPIGDWRKTWERASKGAGLPGKRFHDLRRTVVRNLTRAGVPERVAMSVTGHKTRSVFDRYNIVDEKDLRQATARLGEYVAKLPTAPVVESMRNAQKSG